MKLTPKQKAFADEYLICGNATEAAKKAADEEASQLRAKAGELEKTAVEGVIRKLL